MKKHSNKKKPITKAASEKQNNTKTPQFIVRNKFRRGPRVQIHFDAYTRTKQSFKDECDINLIMARYIKTGAIDHVNKHGPNYGFATSLDFRESLELIANAQGMFDDLPSSIRSKFENDPAQFLEFAQDPNNVGQMADMGLALPQAKDLEPDASQAVSEPLATSPEGVPLPSNDAEK